ncbi:hypothetical protein CC78DRAFT_583468 [Lojkania enalia]|uniref:Uncharacterized protein n=1 Tax=Lojkania enalia TaxID=147567 RepID=A0A9P4N1K5_9PLEO|nr:hypothetical protein CC78DRAFT_583468 [Didymosphaeria enalia]
MENERQETVTRAISGCAEDTSDDQMSCFVGRNDLFNAAHELISASGRRAYPSSMLDACIRELWCANSCAASRSLNAREWCKKRDTVLLCAVHLLAVYTIRRRPLQAMTTRVPQQQAIKYDGSTAVWMPCYALHNFFAAPLLTFVVHQSFLRDRPAHDCPCDTASIHRPISLSTRAGLALITGPSPPNLLAAALQLLTYDPCSTSRTIPIVIGVLRIAA